MKVNPLSKEMLELIIAIYEENGDEENAMKYKKKLEMK
jgi:hypothetical protein